MARGGKEGVGSQDGRKVSYFMSAYLEHEDSVEVVLLDAPPLAKGGGQLLQVLRGDLWAGQYDLTQLARGRRKGLAFRVLGLKSGSFIERPALSLQSHSEQQHNRLEV